MIYSCDFCGAMAKKEPNLIKKSKRNYCSIKCKALAMKKPNKIKIEGDAVTIFINSPKYGEKECFIDKQDLGLIKGHTWFLKFDKTSNGFYAQTRTGRAMHRFIMPTLKGLQIDHKDHNGLNNKRNNLMSCSNSENQQNLKGARNDNKSTGVRNVYKDRNRLKVMMSIGGVYKVFGYFQNTPEGLADAEKLAVEMRIKHMPFSTV